MSRPFSFPDDYAEGVLPTLSAQREGERLMGEFFVRPIALQAFTEYRTFYRPLARQLPGFPCVFPHHTLRYSRLESL